MTTITDRRNENRIFLDQSFPDEWYQMVIDDPRLIIQYRDTGNAVTSDTLTSQEVWDELQKITANF